MHNNIEKKAAFVSGGARGIGREIVRHLIAHNYNVTFTYRNNREAAESLIQECDGSVLGVLSNAADKDSICLAIEKHITQFGRLDYLINNAGINRDKAFKSLSYEDWQQVIDTNLSGTFLHCQQAIKYLIETQGSIINIASVSGLIGVAGQANYAASKAGILGLTRSLAKEYASRGVNVNALAPGFIVTDMTDKLHERVKEQVLDSIPMKRFGSAKDIAEIVTFLGSNSCNYMTGQVIPVDGGLSV
ncbi:3-oxoacyl-ACP reductase FabG [Pseudoalteromonas piscicida]|uniref:3-oxoacyl-ACP reductase FabG n=1 Tax=Pseudoalteromonas piscicida TaxID=43662 RepID=A0AAQ2EVB7_PSEO7|nr:MULTISPECIES: 3-oxoacyl-ACP reductase FabG [Pseudoalteromonas]KJY91558.1 hypothetical protein TW75_04010 [Pseudoalteromonas piscicida]MDP4486825.1 3-oxoacyl-ACP reductase FabG [Pseudoalteromonas piscicida]TMN37714.1 3-oxoacyl-ACP reductase FabG [Pseudoalteromonas piscicida]TMN45835.1 3-oxoacyl-ACP reductase FabG [Pseudoalteromonas piscicida]TMN47571.1 3-oxoacyl-ACP reductase FabG [Pseudoalteromonas piscicida]